MPTILDEMTRLVNKQLKKQRITSLHMPKQKKDVITIPVNISLSLLSSLLCSAFESGGIKYWAEIVKCMPPAKKNFVFRTDKKQIYPHLDYPLNHGGSVVIRDIEADEPKEYHIHLLSLQVALQRMAEQYPKHFADIKREDFDADTADALIQLCCFNETIYG